MKRIVLGGLISLVSLSSMAQWTSDVDKNTDVGNPRNRIYVGTKRCTSKTMWLSTDVVSTLRCSKYERYKMIS